MMIKEQAIEQEYFHKLVSEYIPENIWQEKFTEKEHIVYNMRSNGAKLKEIAAKFNISGNRIRQIYYKAERKLRYQLKYRIYNALIGLSYIDKAKAISVNIDNPRYGNEEIIIVKESEDADEA